MMFRPDLDPEFVPASLWNRAYRARVRESGGGRNLAIARRPAMEQGRGGFSASELEGRLGARVLPDSFDVVDDPTQLARGVDPQLDRGIQEALRLLAQKPFGWPSRPPAENRTPGR